MTPDDHRIIFKALGFLAVILSDVPPDNQALRATALAKLIETFCLSPASDEAEAILHDINRALSPDPT